MLMGACLDAPRRDWSCDFSACVVSTGPAGERQAKRLSTVNGARVTKRNATLSGSRSHATALSVISSPRSMIANASRSSASVMQSGGFVKNVFQRTNV